VSGGSAQSGLNDQIGPVQRAQATIYEVATGFGVAQVMAALSVM